MRLALICLYFVTIVIGSRSSLAASPSGIISTVVGPGSSLSGCSGDAWGGYRPISPTDIIFDSEGRLILAEFDGNRVSRFEPDGSVTLLAGTGKPGFSGDGGPAVNAQLNAPFYLARDPQSRLVISDSLNGRIRRIEADGTIVTVVGGGSREDDGAPAGQTRIERTGGIAFDGQGRLYYADMVAKRARRVEADGSVRTVAGGPSDAAKGQDPDLLGAGAIAFDSSGNLYVTEYGASRIRKRTPDGVFSTIAGNGKRGFAGDGGPATEARFDNPWGLAVRPEGVYVVDAANQRVRRINPDGTVETVAGGGSLAGNSGDGGLATQAGLAGPCCLDFDATGNLWVNDARGMVRKVSYGPLAPGDLDGDGEVTDADAKILLQAIVGLRTLSKNQTSAADANGDGSVNVSDVIGLILRKCPS